MTDTVLGLYLIFCLATALAALYELFWPVVKTLREDHPNHMLSENWKTLTVTLTLGAVLFAPLIVFSTVIPNFAERFRSSLYKSLTTS